MKYLIDNFYFNTKPYFLLPRFLIGFFPKLDFIRPILRSLGKYDLGFYENNGFDGVEFNLGFSGVLDVNFNLVDFRLKKYKEVPWKIYAAHSIFQTNYPYQDVIFNLCTETKERVCTALGNQIRALRELSVCETPILVAHLGKIPKGTDEEVFYQNAKRNIKAVLPIARELGVIVAIENDAVEDNKWSVSPARDYRILKKMFLEIDDDFFQMTFDWGHANTYTIPFAKKTSKKNFREYCENYGYVHEVIDELKDKIVYAHLHYNDANKYSGFVKKRIDAHRPFTDIPFREMEKIRKTYLRLFNETKIEDFKLVNLELPPKKVFFITIYPEAVSDNVQYLENLEFFKKIVQNEE